MRIGSDFDKIEWEFLGMNLLEPNALVGDLLLFTISIMFYLQIRKEATNLFVTYWSRFFLIFAISFIIGGFGHVFFNYTHAAGRIPSWYLGLITPFWIEQAMILLISDEMKNQEKTDSTQNRLIDTQKRENERLRGAVDSLGKELQDFEQQSQETDREVERLKQLSSTLTTGGTETKRKAKLSADDLEKLQVDLETLKTKPGMDSNKFQQLEQQIKDFLKEEIKDEWMLNTIFDNYGFIKQPDQFQEQLFRFNKRLKVFKA